MSPTAHPSSPDQFQLDELVETTAWTRDQIREVYQSPLMELILRAADVHRRHHTLGEVQVCVLLSIKTGGCPEDCAYCPQAARYQSAVDAEPLMDRQAVRDAAQRAKDSGATRFCMGAAWRNVKDDHRFEQVLEMIRDVKGIGLEVCCTLGMVNAEQARRMREAGLDAYNHNLDSSPEFYERIITTRSYQDRLETLDHVRSAGITVCSGGIVGMGETDEDRIGLIAELAQLDPTPESVPINALVPVEGTPLGDRHPIEIWPMLRMIATSRIVMPQAMVRLSAGRLQMSPAEQALCFLAGANSIFAGERLLTTPNPEYDADAALFAELGLRPRPASETVSGTPRP